MNRSIVFALSAALAVSSVSASDAEKFGGMVVRPGSYEGKILLVNAQDIVPESDLRKVADLFAEHTKCNVTVGKASDAATIRLTLVNSADQPTVLLAPEDHWGNVNVAKLTSDLPSDAARRKFLPARARKMMIKALSILCGGGASSFPNNIMNAATPRELDYVDEQIPVDKINAYSLYLKRLGVTKKETATYVDACLAGWAPSPTNDIQRKIWKAVNNPPSKPLKITYDKDKQKPVVK